ncbi:MAG TPA: outer membrane beta-barrel family protein [Paludibacter sp.]|nr:outer membrane beta-barrel family protein [Paludibacter sp.]
MYKLSFSLIILCSFICPNVFCKEISTAITGKVIVEAQHPLEGARVVLLTLKDSSFVDETTSDKSGNFILQPLKSGHYQVLVSMLGYQKATRTALLETGKPINLAPILLNVETHNLQDVIVSGKRPEIEMLADKTVVNIGSSALNSGGSAFSIMQNLPGVIMSNNGTVFLNGKSGAKIMIDGKTSYMEGTELVNYLKSTPASSLDKVELITNPSAKYDASGNSGIINIKTRRTKLMGFNVALNTNYEQGKFGRTNNNISLNHRNGKLNIYGMYGFNCGHNMNDLQMSREFYKSVSTSNSTFIQDSYRKKFEDAHYFNAGIHYFASDNTTFELSANGYLARRNEHGTINSAFYTVAGQNDSTLRSTTDNRNKSHNFSTSLGMLHKIDSMGKEISASVDYLHYSVREDQLHDDLFAAGPGVSSDAYSKGLKNGTIGMYSGRVDLSYPISDKFSFEAGAKSTAVNIDNSSAYENRSGSTWQPDYGLSNQFIYNENINAVYISTKVSQQQFRLEAGIRVENTNLKGHLLGNVENKDTLFRKSYTNLFPTATLTYSFSNKNTLNLIYGRRVDRPNYRDLNPFIYIFDPYTYEQGNTSLQPQFSNNFDLSYIIKNNYRVGLFYNNTQDAIVKSYIVKLGGKRVYVMPTNMATYNSYGVKMGVGNLTIYKFWQSSINMGITRNDYDWQQDGLTYRNELTTLMFHINNRISITKGWSGEITGFYNGKMAFGQINIFPMWRISAGIQKKLWKDNATLSIYSNDIFNSSYTKINGLFNGSSANAEERLDRCIIGVSFSYRFKKGYESKEFKKKGESFDSKRINL